MTCAYSFHLPVKSEVWRCEQCTWEAAAITSIPAAVPHVSPSFTFPHQCHKLPYTTLETAVKQEWFRHHSWQQSRLKMDEQAKWLSQVQSIKALQVTWTTPLHRFNIVQYIHRILEKLDHCIEFRFSRIRQNTIREFQACHDCNDFVCRASEWQYCITYVLMSDCKLNFLTCIF